jgi:hypothetical protein
MGETTIKQIAQRFRAGEHGDIVRAIADWTRTAAAKVKAEPDDDMSKRISAAATAFATPSLVEGSERLGHQFQQWVVGFELSAAFAIARYRTRGWRFRRARGDLDKLLKLAELETAFLIPDLPGRSRSLSARTRRSSRKAQDWCLRLLEAQGPFFPEGARAGDAGRAARGPLHPEVMEYLSDENSYVYGAAERALSLMGEAIVPPVRAKIEARSLDPDVAHRSSSSSAISAPAARYDAVTTNLDWFMEEVGRARRRNGSASSAPRS